MGILNVMEVRPGMCVQKAVYIPDGTQCLLKAGTTLSIKHIQKLKELGIQEVDVADRYTLFVSPEDKMQEALEEDFVSVLRKVSPKVSEANKNDSVMAVADFLEKLINKIAMEEEILQFMMEMRIIDKVRLYDTAIYTAVLSGLIAGCMRLSAENIYITVVGALLHNIGLAEMPTLLTVERRNPQQESLWKEHPTYGYYFALQKKIRKEVADCILYHHEKWNGSGYPKGAMNDEIPIHARIVAVCSSYASNVMYKNITPYMAVEELYGTSGMYYDSKVVNSFVTNIPIYPLGTIVRLSTKEVGIVSNIRKNKGARPVIKVYYNRVNRTITEDKIVDLGEERTVFIEEIL